MNGAVDRAVNRVIEAMYARVGEDLTVDDMARTAMYSKFHFSRAFRQVTGVSPGRFLSALRFQEAKRLLAATSLSVAEISNQVGYSSLGTFSTRFKRSVGVTPTEYRRSGGRCTLAGRMAQPEPAGRSGSATVRGRVTIGLENDCDHTVVGLFASAVPWTLPVRFASLAGPGPYLLADVPEGTWYLLAHGAVPAGTANGDQATGRLAGLTGCLGPFVVEAGAAVSVPELRLRPMRPVDLPVVFAPFVAGPGVGLRPLFAN